MFKVFDKILKKQPITVAEVDSVSEWVMLHWLSGDRVAVQFAQALNVYSSIPLPQKIMFLQGIMPNIKYIKYPKKNKEVDMYIELLSKHYKCTRAVSKLYYELLSTDDLESLYKEYHQGVKQ